MGKNFSEEKLNVAGLGLRLARAGQGKPVVVLHHDIGGYWNEFHDTLAASHAVYAPDLPGFGESERPQWARNVRDLAAVIALALDKLGLDRPAIVGLGFGGWVAAELASFAQGRLGPLVLAAPFGLKPAKGEILDQIQVAHENYVLEGFHDRAAFERQFGREATSDQLVAWDVCREMTTRVAWKPYMYNLALPHLLSDVTLPTLVAWGDDDRIAPRECGEAYVARLKKARLDIVARAGHWIELDQPKALANLTLRHIA